MTDELYNNSIFWIEVDKIKPNPFQPRKEFNEDRLRDLSDSIRQYGVLQPLVVTRQEVEKEDGGLAVVYELIAGERRLRASKMAGLYQVPAVIKTGDQTDKIKLEIAIIENLQREDLNPVDRAQAFAQLANEFNLKHTDIAKKIGKSREYVSNSIRILMLPQEILEGLMGGQITEGHTRPILMLADRPEEQLTLYKEITFKRLTVREAEAIARRIAFDRVRKKEKFIEPEIVELEERLMEKFGTRVKVEKRHNGGQVTIDFFSAVDLKNIIDLLEDNFKQMISSSLSGSEMPDQMLVTEEVGVIEPASDVAEEVKATDDDDLYSLKNFSV